MPRNDESDAGQDDAKPQEDDHAQREVQREPAPVHVCEVNLQSEEEYADDLMIVVTSDHGEEFGEHGGFWHGITLYEEQIHIPLIAKLPKNGWALWGLMQAEAKAGDPNLAETTRLFEAVWLGDRSGLSIDRL